MIVAMVFAHVWGVIQLIVFASLARTIRLRTVFAAMAVGLYACAPLAVLLQVAWSRPAAWVTGTAIHEMVSMGAYTVDPFIEEIVKILPLLVLLSIPVIRRQWSLTDCVLTGAAAGAGLGLAEDLYRYGAAAHLAHAVSTGLHPGWILATDVSLPEVPSFASTLTSWLPPGAAAGAIRFPGVSGHPWLDLHLVWSAVGGLAVGLIRLQTRVVARIAGAILLLYVALDHAAWNGSIVAFGFHASPPPIVAMRHLLAFLPIAALAVAWWIDRTRQRAGDRVEPVLVAEQSASPRLVGTLRAAVSRLPWSLPSVYAFVRMRRVYYSAPAAISHEDTDRLRVAIVDARDRLEQDLAQSKSPRWLPPSWTPSAVLAVRRWPAVILSLVLLTPSFIWFVVGGWPQTAGLQTMLTGPVVWRVVVALSVVSQALIAWYVVVSLRSWPTALRFPVGEGAALSGLRIASRVGALGLGVYAVLRAFTGLSPTQHLLSIAHASNAISQMSLGVALSIFAGLVPGSSGVVYSVLGGIGMEDGVRRLPDAKAEAAWAKADAAGDARKKAEAGQKAAQKYYDQKQAAAHDRGREAGSAYGAFQKAQSDVAKAAGDNEAYNLAMQRAGAADADLSAAMAAAAAAEAARQGALAGLNSAKSKANAASDASNAAAFEAGQAEAEARADVAREGKPKP